MISHERGEEDSTDSIPDRKTLAQLLEFELVAKPIDEGQF